MSYWYLQPLADSYVLVAVLTAILLGMLLFGPSHQQLSRRRFWILTGIRLTVVLLIAITMLRPTWVRTIRETQSALLVVMFDSSRSMTVPDAADGATRWEAQSKALRQLESELEDLGSDIDLAIYQFDENARTVDFAGGKIELPETPDGRFTDIGSSLSQVIQQNVGRRLAGVILLSDGAQRVYTPQVEMQQAARDLARLEAALHTVAFGKAIDPTQARDAAVETLPDHYTVFVKNELSVKASVKIRGMANLPVPVSLKLEDASGNQRTVETQTVTTPQASETRDVIFRYTPEEPGQFKLMVEIPPQEGELVTRNNQLSAYLNVLEGGLRILYLEGRLVDRPEQKFIRQVVAQSADMELDFRWIDRRRRDAWPVDLATEIREGKYDVFILGDLDSTALSAKTLQTLAEQVETGKGLIMLGGFHSFGAGGYQQTVLVDVLPVEMSRFDRQDFDNSIRGDMHLSGPVKMEAANEHFLTELGMADDGGPALSSLPELPGANKVVGGKPRSLTIFQTQSGAPILVAGEYGLGRTLAMLSDSTWRWVLAGKGTIHKRFWRQVILWLARKDGLESRDVWVRLGQRRFVPGARIQFTAGANSQAGEPLRGVTLETTLIGPDGSRSTLQTLPGDAFVEGTFQAAEKVGDYTIEVLAQQDGRTVGTGEGRFFVFDQDLELADPSARPSQLASLSSLTASLGGKTWTAEQLPELIRQIKQRPPETEIEVQTKWTWPESSRDGWINLLLVVGMLGTEWLLRKRWQLV